MPTQLSFLNMPSTFSVAIRWSPLSVQEGKEEPVRPKVLILADETVGTVLGFHMFMTGPTPKEVRDAVLATLDRPGVELPQEILVDDSERALALREAMALKKVPVRVTKVMPAVDAAYAALVRKGEVKEATVSLSSINRKLALDFFRQASWFCEAQPWKLLAPSDILLWTDGDEERAVMVSGQSGKNFGILIYSDLEKALRINKGQSSLPWQGVLFNSNAWLHIRDVLLLEAERLKFPDGLFPNLLQPDLGFAFDRRLVRAVTWLLSAIAHFKCGGGSAVSGRRYRLRLYKQERSVHQNTEPPFLKAWGKNSKKAQNVAALFTEILDRREAERKELLPELIQIGEEYLREVKTSEFQPFYFLMHEPRGRRSASYRKAWATVKKVLFEEITEGRLDALKFELRNQREAAVGRP